MSSRADGGEPHHNIFSKLSEFIPDARRQRVAAVISYLKAPGSLTAELGSEELEPEMLRTNGHYVPVG